MVLYLTFPTFKQLQNTTSLCAQHTSNLVSITQHTSTQRPMESHVQGERKRYVHMTS